MLLLIDNDIFVKMIVFDLLDDMLLLLKSARADIRILSSAVSAVGSKMKEKRRREMTETYGDAHVAAIANAMTGLSIVPGPSGAADEFLDDIADIHPGERTLFAVAFDRPSETLLLTGDKNCLRALLGTPKAKPVADALAGRIYCFEYLLLALIEKLGFEHVLSKIAPERRRDNMTKSIFSSGLETTELHAKKGLSSYALEVSSLMPG